MAELGGVQSLVKMIKAHDRSEITCVIENPYENGEIISIAHDGFLRVWNVQDLTLVREVRFTTPYVMCIVPYSDGYLLGQRKLLQLNKQFEIISSHSIHDLVTSIVRVPGFIVTTGLDGFACFLNESTLVPEKTIQIGTPIFQCIHFDSKLFLAGEPSYQIDTKTMLVTEIGHYQLFIVHANRVFACSDQLQISTISSNSSIPLQCQFMLSVEKDILLTNDQGLGVIKNSSQQIEYSHWSIKKTTLLKPGVSILSGLAYKNYIILSSCDGNLYRIDRNITDELDTLIQ